jgi:hypothetical protein
VLLLLSYIYIYIYISLFIYLFSAFPVFTAGLLVVMPQAVSTAPSNSARLLLIELQKESTAAVSRAQVS